MTEYSNENSGALFKNEDRKTDNHPHYRGNLNVGGREYWISAWLKESRKGTKYMSLSVQPKEERAARSEPAAKQDGFDDDIPFS